MSTVAPNRVWRLKKLGEKASTFSPSEIVNNGVDGCRIVQTRPR